MKEFKQDQPLPTGDENLNVLAGVRNQAQSSKSSTDGNVVPLAVDGTGALITTSLPGTAGLKAEDTAAASGDTGCVELVRRTDTLAAQTDTDGDYTVPTANSFGAQYANIDLDAQKSNSKGLLKPSDNATGYATSDAGVVILGCRNDNGGTSFASANNRYGPLAIDAAGQIKIGNLNPGTGATALGKSEDAAHADGDVGIMALARRIDTPAVSSGTSGDYSTFNVDANGALYTAPQPTPNGGLSTSRLNAAGSNNATSVKASAGAVYAWEIFNASASVRYVKLYNKASAPAPGSDNALLLDVIGIPAGQRASFASPHGIAFSTGIAFAIVTGASDTDNTSVTAGDVILAIHYK